MFGRSYEYFILFYLGRYPDLAIDNGILCEMRARAV